MIATEPQALPSYKELTEALKDGLTPAAQEKILDLRQSVMAIQEENLRLRERIRQLEAAATAANPAHKVIFDKGVYWTIDGQERLGPFCPACQDKNAKLVRLHYCHTGTPGVYWLCKSCQQSW